MQTHVDIDSLHDGIDFNLTVMRAKFEHLCSDLFVSCMKPVEQVLRDAKMDKGKVDEIVLVGGSTRIPKVQELIKSFFNGKEPCKSINPDEAVAYGAAVQAAILSGVESKHTNELLLLDVAPLSIGIETAGGIMTTLISRNTTIPAKKTQVFSTYSDNQREVLVQIYEGESKITGNNEKLGQFALMGIPPRPRGVPLIEVQLNIDANGILTVTAEEKSSNITNNIVVTNTSKQRLSEEEIEQAVKLHKEQEEEDNKRYERITARNHLEQTTLMYKGHLSDKNKFATLNKEEKEHVNKLTVKVDEVAAIIDAKMDLSKEECENHKSELDSLAKPVITLLSKCGGMPCGGGGEGMPDGMPDMGGMPQGMPNMESEHETAKGPKIEEVD